MELKPYPSKVITLANAEKMVVREAQREEINQDVYGFIFDTY